MIRCPPLEVRYPLSEVLPELRGKLPYPQRKQGLEEAVPSLLKVPLELQGQLKPALPMLHSADVFLLRSRVSRRPHQLGM